MHLQTEVQDYTQKMKTVEQQQQKKKEKKQNYH